jgi:hypothetical protein
VRGDPGEVGAVSGGVMSPLGSTPVRPITGRRSLPPPSFTRRPMGDPRGSLSPMGRTTGLPRSVDVPGWVGPPLFAGGAASAPGELEAPGPDHVPFWPERGSIFRSSYVTTFITASHYVDPSTRSWSPTALMLAVAASARAPVAILSDEDTLSRGLRTPPLPATRASVGYCWQNSRCCRPLRGRSTATSTTSCRTLTPQISGPPQAGPLHRLVQVSRFAAGTSDSVQCTAPVSIGHRHPRRSHRSVTRDAAVGHGSWQW